MLSNIIYIVVFLILAFVLSIAVKAITRGVEAKQNNKLEFIEEQKLKSEDLNFVNQIKELKKLHEKKIINDEEFEKAKKKILNN